MCDPTGGRRLEWLGMWSKQREKYMIGQAPSDRIDRTTERCKRAKSAKCEGLGSVAPPRS